MVVERGQHAQREQVPGAARHEPVPVKLEPVGARRCDDNVMGERRIAGPWNASPAKDPWLQTVWRSENNPISRVVVAVVPPDYRLRVPEPRRKAGHIPPTPRDYRRRTQDVKLTNCREAYRGEPRLPQKGARCLRKTDCASVLRQSPSPCCGGHKAASSDRTKAKLFQFLSDVGTKALRTHLGRLLGMADVSKDKTAYEAHVTRIFGHLLELFNATNAS